jgi:translocator assembly and maintenance protein 41
MMLSSSVIIRRCCWRRAVVDTPAARTFSSRATEKLVDSEPPHQQKQSPLLLTNNNELSAIVNSFPTGGIEYAFGYGSGVLKQQSSSVGMVDIILAVDDSYSWHKHNLQSHPHHYSGFARIGGANFVHWMQNLGARIYFHPFVEMELSVNDMLVRREIKYGVVSTDDLIEDLTCWKYLYLAGRMHKPTVEIDLITSSEEQEERMMQEQVNRRDEIAEAQQQNLLAAVSASILLHGGGGGGGENKDSLPLVQLHNTIAGISYAGDIRMQTGAEDPNKVKKLVETPGMQALWDNMYSTIYSDMQSSGILTKDEVKVELDFNDIAMRKQLMQNLPKRLQSEKIVGVANSNDSILQGSELLRTELANIVAPAAKSQSIKGFFSAGVAKSFKYAMAKLAKGRLKK